MGRAADAGATTLDLERLIDARRTANIERAGEPAGSGVRPGPFRAPRRGQGMEFDDLRPYAAGDDVRRIDWRTSARRDATHTRLYREEREHVATIALDLRDSMFTGSATLRSVVAGLLAAHLLWRASAGGSRTGVATLDDAGGVRLSRAGAGERGALDGCRLIGETFARARERAVSATSATLETLLDRLENGGRGLGASIVISGLDEPGAGFDVALERLATARPLAVVHVEDPLERAPPPNGRYRYRGATGESTVVLGRRERHLLEGRLTRRREAIAARFADARVPLLDARAGHAAVARSLRDAGLLP